jgi:ribose/xylose/arabinose/galactoside ABC-type transport system permease subunit
MDGNQGFEDPGWGLSRASRRANTAALITLRFRFLSQLLAPLLLFVVLAGVLGRFGHVDGTIALIVILLGLLGVALALVIPTRSLDVSDAAMLAASYRVRLFLALALNEIPLLIAFVLCFLRGEWWPYAFDLPFFLVGMAMIAPGRNNLARLQRRIQEQGSRLSLVRAIAYPPSEP